jgi:hypothetical protein
LSKGSIPGQKKEANMAKRKKRVVTPELRRRWKLKNKLSRLGINLTDLEAATGLGVSANSRFLNGDTGVSEAEKHILRAIEAKERQNKAALEKGRLVYV